MTTGVEHYRRAGALAEEATRLGPVDPEAARHLITVAVVHARLADVAARVMETNLKAGVAPYAALIAWHDAIKDSGEATP